MVSLLIASLTSLQSILEAVHQLAPEGALGTAQRTLISQALDLIRLQRPDNTAFAETEARSQTHSRKTGSEVLVDNGQESPLSNIVVSPHRNHDAVVTDKHRKDSDSDFSPRNHHTKNKRKTEQTHHQPSRLITTKDSPQPTLQPVTSQFTPINQPTLINQPTPKTSPTKSPPTSKLNRAPAPQRKRRPLLAALAISTALPPNSPPIGPNCHCHASSEDPTLVACEGCLRLYHPRCVGKGGFARATYNLKDEVGYMLKDVEKFCQQENGDGDDDWYGEGMEFRCGECDGVYLGSR